MTQPDLHMLPNDNIRTLLHDLGNALDERFAQFRRGTIYESVRPSDVRVFVRATRAPQTISEIARSLGVSRQAVQISVQRLQKLQVLSSKSSPQNKRDRIVVVTARGQHAASTAAHQVQRVEKEFVEAIGPGGLLEFRNSLVTILKVTRTHNEIDAAKGSVPV